jgi:primase-polymerase (primpol)-like protein
MPKPDVSQLLDKSKRRPRQNCWRARLEDPTALAYIEAVEEDPESHSYAGIGNVLRNDLGFAIGKDRIADHYKGRCSCPPKTS